ncbi:MAG: Ig-like domain-containing protein [Mucilaginibacter sp.]
MRKFLLLCFFLVLAIKGYSQTCASPLVVDLSKKADTSTTYNGSRSGSCCGDNNCIVFAIKVNPNTDMINFSVDQITGASFYTVNCGPLIPSGTPACIAGLTNIQISFCKPGNNAVNYTITAIRGTSPSGNLNLRQGCTGTMSVTGFQQSTISWTSIYPGAAGAYNSYLNQTTAVASVNVTPQSGSPAYIDYKVSGIESTLCALTRSDTIRVYTYAPLAATITPTSPAICGGAPVTLTASPTGGDPAYTYLWSTGATTASISVSTPGTYSVSVNDQIPTCGPVTAQATVTTVTPVAPTVSPATICSGNTTTLTATAPGGPYQWYDAATNGNLLYTGTTYTTPVLSTTTTYYVQDAFSGCASTRTSVKVTVNPSPTKPTIH